MYCSDEGLDALIYDFDVFLVLLVIAEFLVLDTPDTGFFIAPEVVNAMLTHSVDAESISQKKFHCYAGCQFFFKMTQVDRRSLQEPRKFQSRSILRF